MQRYYNVYYSNIQTFVPDIYIFIKTMSSLIITKLLKNNFPIILSVFLIRVFGTISWRRGGYFYCAPLTRAFHVQHFMWYKLDAKVARTNVGLVGRRSSDKNTHCRCRLYWSKPEVCTSKGWEILHSAKYFFRLPFSFCIRIRGVKYS